LYRLICNNIATLNPPAQNNQRCESACTRMKIRVITDDSCSLTTH